MHIHAVHRPAAGWRTTAGVAVHCILGIAFIACQARSATSDCTPRHAKVLRTSIGPRTIEEYRRLQDNWRQPVMLAEWREAVERYTASVSRKSYREMERRTPGVTSYLDSMHWKLHPIFAHGFLASLIPPGAPLLLDPDFSATAEIVLDGADGALLRTGIVKRSTSVTFDAGVLESIRRAGHFGASSHAMRSTDGRVYLHWTFYRDEYYACSPYFARPYHRNARPESAGSTRQ